MAAAHSPDSELPTRPHEVHRNEDVVQALSQRPRQERCSEEGFSQHRSGEGTSGGGDSDLIAEEPSGGAAGGSGGQRQVAMLPFPRPA
eukprot:SAG22_NODE_18397_length_288_cov_0.798942_1_plen_87_part_10